MEISANELQKLQNTIDYMISAVYDVVGSACSLGAKMKYKHECKRIHTLASNLITELREQSIEYRYGKHLYDEVRRDMLEGKPICLPEDAGLLAQIICGTTGDHLEIGTAFGGTAVIALKAMDYCERDGKVVCIDPFGEDKSDTVYKAVEKEFWKNIERFGVEDRIEHIKKVSHPLPIKNGRRFATALIDGNHDYEYVLNDWMNLKDMVDNYIMFHDYRKLGVKRVVDEHAVLEKGWSLSSVHGWSALLEKNNAKT